LSGFTRDGKISRKDLQEIYDQAYASQLIPTPVPAARVMDSTFTASEVIAKHAKSERQQELVRQAAHHMVHFKIAKFAGIYNAYA
jgi:hypothetical protein